MACCVVIFKRINKFQFLVQQNTSDFSYCLVFIKTIKQTPDLFKSPQNASLIKEILASI